MSASKLPSLLSIATWLAKGAFLMMSVPGLVSTESDRCHSAGANGLKVLTLCRWYEASPFCKTHFLQFAHGAGCFSLELV